ncbi:hypothetical protein [Murimonas intestini]|uniref:hypothetical protein n=1 Tax=Murimonas intestini TaxID=1337051 RepID=UPI0011DDA353|nr:hypothetical protein [Murimonas intestini]
MFFKKKDGIRKRVICPISVIIQIIQDTIDIDAGMSEFVINFEGKEHKVGFTSDFSRSRGFFDPMFYLDEQEFDNFQAFKTEAVLEGEIFAQRTDDVEIIDADNGTVKFPWYTELEKYVV